MLALLCQAGSTTYLGTGTLTDSPTYYCQMPPGAQLLGSSLLPTYRSYVTGVPTHASALALPIRTSQS